MNKHKVGFVSRVIHFVVFLAVLGAANSYLYLVTLPARAKEVSSGQLLNGVQVHTDQGLWFLSMVPYLDAALVAIVALLLFWKYVALLWESVNEA
jgi:divalent metal cation (Fe/Co/Zn/Cd) transporter